ncbi:COG1361 S-layer family protein [Thermoplasma sp.]|uniref:COG1361 S-layer family protein n=1 Tax=Thermoplasma sp. TaxID=1973142 RepID=UPI0012716BBC|nr:COG1361 S-layer family protein [Thermoplasma sp.]KAA8922988.1 MAG: hypothetical protein F6Q11_01970 [Thermoplasma sp.]
MRTRLLLVIMFSTIVILSGFSGLSAASVSPPEPQVVSVSWFSPNSTETVAPGMSDVPLIVTFISPLTLEDASVYLNLTKYNPSVLNYVNLHGYPSGPAVYNFTEIPSGEQITVMQLVNVSSDITTGGYREDLYVQGINSSAVDHFNVSFTAYILGSTQVTVAASYFGTPESQFAASPGMKNIPMTLVLENIGNVIDQNVSIEYIPSYPFYGYQQYFNISAIPPDETASVTFTVSVFNNASDGFYSQNLSVSVYGKTSLVQFRSGITGYTNITLVNTEIDPPVVYTNENFIVFKAFIEVTGNSVARYLNVTVESSDFTDLTNEYHLSYVSPGIYNFTFIMNSLSSYGPEVISVVINGLEFPVDVYVHNQPSPTISYHQSSMQPGVDKSVMYFNITNDGNETMYDIRAYLMLPGILTIHVPSSNPLASLTADNITIPSLDPGQTYELVFLVDTSSAASPGNYPVELFLGWHYNNTSYEFIKTFKTNASVSPTVEEKISQAFTFTPLTIGVLVAIAAVIIGLAVYAGVRRKKR